MGDNLDGVARIFYLWNVKRIRPIEMWPYDYARENETPLLWVCEGFSNYYGQLAIYRAGLSSRNTFLSQVTSTIRAVENDQARALISPAASSVAAWLGYDTGVPFAADSYAEGENLGTLLDLSIRHDAHGRASLDDVMRSLYRDFYQRGRGFSTEDMIGIIKIVLKVGARDGGDTYSLVQLSQPTAIN